MRNRVRPTRAGLFFIELMIAVGVFAFCAAICIGLFTSAEKTSRSDMDLVQAMNVARDAGEYFKAAHGDLRETAGMTQGYVEDGELTLLYDEDWQQVSPIQGDGAVFRLSLCPDREGEGYLVASIQVFVQGEEDAPMLSWEVAALED